MKDNCELVVVIDRQVSLECLSERYHCFSVSDFEHPHPVLDKVKQVFVAAGMNLYDYVVAAGDYMTLCDFFDSGQIAD